MTHRGGEPSLARRYDSFANQMFALVEVRLLLGQMNYNPSGTGNIVAGPITASRIPRWRNDRSNRIGGSLVSGFELLAARQQNKHGGGQETTIQGARSHAEADGNAALV